MKSISNTVYPDVVPVNNNCCLLFHPFPHLQARVPVRPGIPGQRVPPVDGVAQGERDRQRRQRR